VKKLTCTEKRNVDYIVEDSIYTYFVVNSVATVGLFLNSYNKKKFPPADKVSKKWLY